MSYIQKSYQSLETEELRTSSYQQAQEIDHVAIAAMPQIRALGSMGAYLPAPGAPAAAAAAAPAAAAIRSVAEKREESDLTRLSLLDGAYIPNYYTAGGGPIPAAEASASLLYMTGLARQTIIEGCANLKKEDVDLIIDKLNRKDCSFTEIPLTLENVKAILEAMALLPQWNEIDRVNFCGNRVSKKYLLELLNAPLLSSIMERHLGYKK